MLKLLTDDAGLAAQVAAHCPREMLAAVPETGQVWVQSHEASMYVRTTEEMRKNPRMYLCDYGEIEEGADYHPGHS